MHEKNTLKIIWYLFSALLMKWAVELVIGVFLMSLGVKNVGWISMCSSAATLPIVFYMYRKDRECYEREGELWWKCKAKAGMREYLLLAGFGASLCILCNNLLNLINAQSIDSAYAKMAEELYRAPQPVLFLGAGILAPVVEEIVYRGMIYRRMRERLPIWQAALFVSVLFGIGHGYLIQCLYALIQGMFLAYVYEKFRTIKASILLHIVLNMTVLLMNWAKGFDWMLQNFMRAAIITGLMAAATLILFEKIKNIKREIKE